MFCCSNIYIFIAYFGQTKLTPEGRFRNIQGVSRGVDNGWPGVRGSHRTSESPPCIFIMLDRLFGNGLMIIFVLKFCTILFNFEKCSRRIMFL